MTTQKLTIEYFQQIMLAVVAGDGATFVSDPEREFDDLGYDSIARLEAIGRIGREFGIVLDDSLLTTSTTPRSFVDAVNDAIAAVAAA